MVTAGIISMVGITSVVIAGHFGGRDHFDGGDHFNGGGTCTSVQLGATLSNLLQFGATWC